VPEQKAGRNEPQHFALKHDSNGEVHDLHSGLLSDPRPPVELELGQDQTQQRRRPPLRTDAVQLTHHLVQGHLPVLRRQAVHLLQDELHHGQLTLAPVQQLAELAYHSRRERVLRLGETVRPGGHFHDYE
jgi:hypothetical protein